MWPMFVALETCICGSLTCWRIRDPLNNSKAASRQAIETEIARSQMAASGGFVPVSGLLKQGRNQAFRPSKASKL